MQQQQVPTSVYSLNNIVRFKWLRTWSWGVGGPPLLALTCGIKSRFCFHPATCHNVCTSRNLEGTYRECLCLKCSHIVPFINQLKSCLVQCNTVFAATQQHNTQTQRYVCYHNVTWHKEPLNIATNLVTPVPVRSLAFELQKRRTSFTVNLGWALGLNAFVWLRHWRKVFLTNMLRSGRSKAALGQITKRADRTADVAFVILALKYFDDSLSLSCSLHPSGS